MNFRTISQLPPITDISSLGSESLIEVSKAIPPLSVGDPLRFQSHKLTVDKFAKHVEENALKTLKGDEFGIQHDQMWAWLQRIVANNPDSPIFEISGDNLEFKNFPKIEGSLTSFFDPDERIVNVDTMRNFMAVNSPMFINSKAGFSTSYFNVENNLMLDTDEAPSVNGEKHNSYLFRINGTESNEWVTTDSGIFTCYGWVDEATEGETDNARRWIALEGKIGDEEGDDAWKILQVQPFIHNLFCSYVGFTFPVDKGLSLRLRTGFKVGTNSNKYQSTQGSLTNHIANAFVGGIYHTQKMNNSFRRDMDSTIEPITGNTTVKALKEKVNAIIGVINGES